MYTTKNHLGNIQVNYTLAKGSLVILNEHHYYAFGLEHTYYNTTKKEFRKQEGGGNNHVIIMPVANEEYNFKFGSKEYQTSLDLNLYDFVARNYDPALGRWMNIDAFAGAFKSVSPYNYALNNPVVNIDPSGHFTYDWRGLPNNIGSRGQTTFGFAMDGGPGGGGGGGGSGGTDIFGITRQSPTSSTNTYDSLLNLINTSENGDTYSPDGNGGWTLTGINNAPGVTPLGEVTVIAFNSDSYRAGADSIMESVYGSERYSNGGFLTRTNLAYSGVSAYGAWVYRGGRYVQTNGTIGDFTKTISKNAKLSSMKASAFKNAGIVGNLITAGIIIYDVAQDGQIQTSNIVNGGLMAIGITFTLVATAPVAAVIGTAIFLYGVADYAFDIGGYLDSKYGQHNVNPLRP